MRVIVHIFHCAGAIRPHDFYFQSKIWRHHRVPRPRFPTRRRNLGNSRRCKADIGLLISAWIFRTSWPKMGVRGKMGERVVRCWPSTNSFLLLGVLTSMPILVKVDQECNRESARRRTDTLTHWQMQTDFYNLSHAVCYSYGADKKQSENPAVTITTRHSHQQQTCNTASTMKPVSGRSCLRIPEEMNRCRWCIPC